MTGMNDRGGWAREPWRMLESRPVYANPWIRVREDLARMPDGRTTVYGVVECAPAVGVLPFLDDRTVVLVGQYRYVAGDFYWEMPTGAVRPGESHEAAVQRELAEEAGIELPDPSELVLWSRWITPEVVAVRFDTQFFIGLAPPHAPPRPDETEVSEAAWFEPRAALDAQQAGEIELVFPTVKTLESLLGFATADEVLAAARERTVEPILPRVVGTREEHRILLPGDPEYD